MSRWKETLCGSAIKGADDMLLNKPEILMGRTPEAISCGGKYLPTPPLVKKENKQSKTVFLFNKTADCIVAEGNQANRYSSDGASNLDDEIDVIQNAMEQFSTKLTK